MKIYCLSYTMTTSSFTKNGLDIFLAADDVAAATEANIRLEGIPNHTNEKLFFLGSEISL